MRLSRFVDFLADPFLCEIGLADYAYVDLIDFLRILPTLRTRLANRPGPSVHPTARISRHANVGDGAVIGPGCIVGEFSTVRDGTVLGSGVEVGFGCEVARSIILRDSRLSHRVTVVDAVIGANVHLGAGAVTANTHLFNDDMKTPDREIVVRLPGGGQLRCGTAKFAGILGDGARIGMGALVGPGILVGRAAVLYPGTVLSSQLIPDETVVKITQTRVVVERRRHDAHTDRPA